MEDKSQEASKHRHFTQGLVVFDEDFGSGSYIDIKFVLSGESSRSLVIKLLFMPPSLDPAAAETMHAMLGGDVANGLSIQVVSFYNTGIDDTPSKDGNPFGKPEGAFALQLDELNYLYMTIVKIIFRVADTEKIELLFFGADTSALKRIYDRYIKRYAEKLGFFYETQGAYYAIRTQHYPGEG